MLRLLRIRSRRLRRRLVGGFALQRLGGLGLRRLGPDEARLFRDRLRLGGRLRSDLGGCLGAGCKVVGGFDFVDLDGPIFMAEDRTPSVRYENGTIWCPDEVWGSGELVLQ